MTAVSSRDGASEAKLPTIHHLYNSFFFAGDWAPELDIDGFRQIRSPDGALTADCLVVHLPSILSTNTVEQLCRLRKTAPARQVWVAETLESAVNYPQLDDPEFMSLFNIELSYRQKAEVWLPYIPREFAKHYRHVRTGHRRKSCCAFVSSTWDKSNRREYIRELMLHLKVDSFGLFARNKRILFDRGVPTKLRLLKKYQYTLAFENSLTPDYITEKFYEPLLTGTVPIYFGAPNIDEFAPGDNCYINVQDFASPAQLAEFLRDTNPLDFQAWRQHDLASGFQNLLEQLRVPWQTRLANVLTERFLTER